MMAIAVKAGSDRVSKLREKMRVQRSICLERGYWFTESYKETEGETPVIRKAKAVEKVLKEMTIGIEDGELIVGKATSKIRSSALLPELRWEWYLKEMDTMPSRYIDPYVPLTEEEKTKMKEFLPFWKGRALQDKWCPLMLEDALKMNVEMQSKGGSIQYASGPHDYPGHTSADYEKVLTKGLNGIEEEVDRELGSLNLANIENLNKYQFLRAIKITFAAARNFAGRYAELARSMAEKETDSQRKAELEKIAEICEWVPAKPARSFHEALQSVWFTYIVIMIEGWAGGSFGRPDQYLYPLYKKDIAGGRITRQEAQELLALLLIKNNELVSIKPQEIAMMWAGGSSGLGLTLGGVTREGADAVNELSYLFLDAEMDVRLQEDLVIRVHKTTPDAFLMKACEVAKELKGKLKFVSDEVNIQRLLKDGKPIQYARDYVIIGCFCITVPARSFDFLLAGMADLPLMLELALNNGVSRLTGEQMGPQTGDPRQFKSYDEVWEAYKKQVEASIRTTFVLMGAGHQLMADYYPIPFQSALFEGCIEKGIDMLSGGTAPYFSGGVNLSGATNVADSLAVIKKLVFEDKKITMAKLIDALDKNFEGEEEVLHLISSVPKFGNDDDYVDSLMNEVIIHASNEAVKFRGYAGALTTCHIDAGPRAITDGLRIGALPDGRKAREPVTESGVSPYLGRDRNGPTATMRSVTKVDHLNFTNGSVLNMKFTPDALKDESKMRRFAALIRTYLETGGGLVQFNIVGGDTLRDAQKHPEKYRDLLVRVATYSAYFVELPREAQDNIIERTEYEEV